MMLVDQGVETGYFLVVRSWTEVDHGMDGFAGAGLRLESENDQRT